MKTVIFAGGIGTRLSEETYLKPKPMVEVGGKPILWHILEMYEAQGYNDFVICLGYKGYVIKEYFFNYFLHNSDVTIDLSNNDTKIHTTNTENFKVTLIDTGYDTRTAGRLQRVKEHLGNEPFFLTYGDGVANVDLKKLHEFHLSHGKTATVTAVQPAGRFGGMQFGEDFLVTSFKEKTKGDGHWINGGFFVLNPDVFDYLDPNCDDQMWEEKPIESLRAANQLMAHKHDGFWRCMDALRDKVILDELWESGNAGWKVW